MQTDVPGANDLKAAAPGDQLTREDLEQARSFLNDQIKALTEAMGNATDSETVQVILDQQNELGAMANALTAQSILLATGEAKITAEHINSAVRAARDVIDRVADIKEKLAKLGAVLDFFAAVQTGSGTTIVKAARDLKRALQT